MGQIKVLVTRAAHQAGKLSQLLRSAGFGVIELPVIAFGEPDNWDRVDSSLKDLSSYDWVVFSSANAVDSLVKRMKALNISISELRSRNIAAVGKSVEQALASCDVPITLISQDFSAQSLLQSLVELPNLTTLKFLWPRTSAATDAAPETLRNAGANVDVVTTYTSELPENSQQLSTTLKDLILRKEANAITLASAQTVRNLHALLSTSFSQAEIEKQLKDIVIATIGPETTAAARKAFGKVDLEASPHTAEALSDGLRKRLLAESPAHD
jgi:uroporphyrinogen-III synthase